jgi:hypothetical protein
MGSKIWKVVKYLLMGVGGLVVLLLLVGLVWELVAPYEGDEPVRQVVEMSYEDEVMEIVNRVVSNINEIDNLMGDGGSDSVWADAWTDAFWELSRDLRRMNEMDVDEQYELPHRVFVEGLDIIVGGNFMVRLVDPSQFSLALTELGEGIELISDGIKMFNILGLNN